MLRLRTFGGLSIENGASMRGAATHRRPLALLAVLAANGGRGVSRDTIVALLWPESDAEHARNSLSQVISVFRRESDAGDLVLGTVELRLNTDAIACDVIEFEQDIVAGDLEAATRLYAGPFLDGVFLKNAPEFERWVDQERARLQHACGDALEALATSASDREDHVTAVRLWRRRANLEPTDSRVARKLMESLVSSGDPAGAVRYLHVHQTLLRDDLGLEADATLMDFAAALRSGTGQSVTDVAGAPGHVTEPATRPDQPALAPNAPVAPVIRRKRALLPAALAMAAILVIGGAATWGTAKERFGFGPPPPPAYDSLRLRIVTASVQSIPADSILARGVREAALAELAKDPWLFVVTPSAFVAQAPIIGLDEKALSQPDTIRKYARKLRTHAIIDFGFSRAASGYVLTAEARSASSDSTLGVIAEAAASAVDLPAAMNLLGRGLRERLVAARSRLTPTKWSANTTDEPAQAIELYIEGRSEANRRNWIEAARRAEAAVEIDSTFAQAWRLVHTSLFNAGLSVDGQLKAISAAFRFSNRVRAPFWRLDIVSAYYRVMGDNERALVFYDSIDHIAPSHSENIALSYMILRRHELATRTYRHYVNTAQGKYITEGDPPLVSCLLDEGKVVEAQQEVAHMWRLDSMSPRTFQGRAFVFSGLREWDSLGVLGKSSLARARTATDSAPGLKWVAEAAMGRGQLDTFDRMTRLTAMLIEKHGSLGDYLAAELTRARLRATLASDTTRARAIADSGLGVAHWESLTPMDRPYLVMLLYLASVGDVARGAEVATEWSRSTPAEYKRRDSLNILVGRGELALASGNAREAIRLFKIADVRDCEWCFYPRYARAYDALGERDSARVWFERFAGVTAPLHTLDDAELAHAYLRLGELYEERRDSRAAVAWYERFTALWARSDTPALQARVREIRGRVDRLAKVRA